MPPPRPRWNLVLEVSLVVAFVALVARGILPIHAVGHDGDALMVLSCAQRAVDGEWPLFRSEGRNGAAECYLAAPWVALLGRTRETWVVIAIVAAMLTALATAWFARVAFPAQLHPSRPDSPLRRATATALLFVVPVGVMGFTTFVTNYWVVIFWVWVWLRQVFLVEQDGVRHGRGAALWLAPLAALGAWQTLLTLALSVPALVLLTARRKLSVSVVALCAAGLLVGLWPTLHVRANADDNREFDGRPISLTLAPIASQQAGLALRRVVVERLPALFAGSGSVRSPAEPAPGGIERARRAVVLAGYALALAVLLWSARIAGPGSAHFARVLQAGAMTAGVLAVNLLYRSAALPGSALTRYLIPLAPLAAWAVAYAVTRLPRAAIVVALGLMWATVQLAGYPGHWWSSKEDAVRARRGEEEMLAWLRENRVEAVLGTFWAVQHWNHLDAPGEVSKTRNPPAVPCPQQNDYLGVGRRLSEPKFAALRRWALVDRRVARAELEAFGATLGAVVESVERGGYRAVVFDAPFAPAEVVRSFRAGCHARLGR